jgi:ABC-type lipoprotein export system ATPase subunit
MDRFRGRSIGVVFQRLHLLSAISVLNNLLLAQRLARMAPDKKKAMTLLDRLGIAGQAHALPAMLSQGQAQRAAIARAVIHSPSLVIGDEPTSALDNSSAADAIQLIKELSESVGFALLIVTHDERVRWTEYSILRVKHESPPVESVQSITVTAFYCGEYPTLKPWHRQYCNFAHRNTPPECGIDSGRCRHRSRGRRER